MDDVFDGIVRLRDAGREGVLVTVVQSDGSVPARPGAKMLVGEEGWLAGTVGGGAVEKAAIQRARELLSEKRPALFSYELTADGEPMDAQPTGMVFGSRLTLFYDYLGYAAHIFILGAGHVSRAVARHLRDMRCYVTVIDHRPELGDGLEGANKVLIGEYVGQLQGLSVPEGSYFLIATPSHAFDYGVLRHIMASGWKPRYVGMLGSRKKAQALIAQLAEELGADRVDWSALYCPVELDLGGSAPDEIAISVLAEMQALRYDKAGHKHMRITAPADQS
ncbi:MAG: hypothetical protein FJZ90_13655 [Chloroflexi bacterium]|nr:hypothetical protein [Chloroflexota bacterium]